MGHGKLKKFAENTTFRCLLQPDASSVLAPKAPGSKALVLRDHPIKGNWGRDMFGNDNPIVLELGCGKGDYTIALARRHPEINYIGVDIKGARLWSGAKEATLSAMPNVAFLRTRIEFIGAFFGPSEVSEIWLTFSDPQLRGSENSRLSSPLFLDRYRGFLRPGGIVHLKTDSRYLYEYTSAVCKVNGLHVLASGTDVYGEGVHVPEPSASPTPPTGHGFGDMYPLSVEEVTSVQTFYEKMFLDMGLPITYLAFRIDHEGAYEYPGEAFDHEYWLEKEGPRRSFSHQPNKKQ
ncbi:MAG: tRNA (guanosine(46)-N7)-methyltransferase TrmB [Bacteroidales bacterium]|nr:tRNA (guanosine(46)-N7)-methyltransferase TrmB [Bacteroidales bacterium]